MKEPELFTLIKTMSKAEKRFFRIFSEALGGKTTTSYLELFDCLEEMEVYSGEALKEQLKAKAFYKHLATTKNRLFNQILRSLRTLNEGRDIDSKLKSLLHEISLLFIKGLLRSCEKRLIKALQLAIQHEREEKVIELLDWYWKVLSKKGIKEQTRSIELQVEEVNSCLERLSQISQLKYLYEQIRILARLQPRARTPEIKKSFDLIIQSPMLQTLPPRGQLMCTIYYFLSHTIYQTCLGDYKQATDLSRHLIEVWDQNQSFIPGNSDLYLQSHLRFLNSLFREKKHFDEFSQAVKKLRNIPNLNGSAANQFKWTSYQEELIYSMNFELPDRTDQLICEIEGHILDSTQDLSFVRQISFYYNFTVFYFIQGKWSFANKWVIRIVNLPEGQERQDIRDFARLMQILMQYELQNFELNEYLLRSTYRYMTRNKRYHEFEKMIVNMIKQTLQSSNKEEKAAVFRNFQTSLEQLRKKMTGRNLLGLQEISLWTQAKLNQQPIAEIYNSLRVSNLKELDTLRKSKS